MFYACISTSTCISTPTSKYACISTYACRPCLKALQDAAVAAEQRKDALLEMCDASQERAAELQRAAEEMEEVTANLNLNLTRNLTCNLDRNLDLGLGEARTHNFNLNPTPTHDLNLDLYPNLSLDIRSRRWSGEWERGIPH